MKKYNKNINQSNYQYLQRQKYNQKISLGSQKSVQAKDIIVVIWGFSAEHASIKE